MMLLLPGTSSFVALAGLAAGQTCFFMAQWQEYYTGVLRTSFGPVGVTETQFALMAAALAVGCAGPSAVHAKMTSTLEVPWSSTPLPLGHVAARAWIGFCSMMGAICGLKTVTHVFKEGGMAALLGALKNLLPIVSLNVLQFLWSPSLYASAPREICMLTGLHFFHMTAQIILFSMAKMPFPTLQPGLLLYGSLVALSRSSKPMYPVLIAANAGTSVLVLLWVHTVIAELKEKLGIHAFSLAKKQKD